MWQEKNCRNSDSDSGWPYSQEAVHSPLLSEGTTDLRRIKMHKIDPQRGNTRKVSCKKSDSGWSILAVTPQMIPFRQAFSVRSFDLGSAGCAGPQTCPDVCSGALVPGPTPHSRALDWLGDLVKLHLPWRRLPRRPWLGAELLHHTGALHHLSWRPLAGSDDAH